MRATMQAAIAASIGEHDEVHHRGVVRRPATLLDRLQADVRDDRRPPGAPAIDEADERFVVAADDRSVQVHSCTGRARQVEVLRDAVLHLFADDPTLEPRDVIVMCPDIEVFAPLVQATFGSADDAEADRPGSVPQLAVRLADRSVRQVNPVLAAVSALLELAASRVTAPELVDFAGLEPVRRRFRFDDEALARIEEWIATAGVRWGLDAEHRRPFRSTCSRPTPGVPVSTACCSGSAWPRTTSHSSAACSRSTTSTAATSPSPDAWPSWSTACTRQ